MSHLAHFKQKYRFRLLLRPKFLLSIIIHSVYTLHLIQQKNQQVTIHL